ncbi:MAG: FHA domain-containing protein [Lachnospiraceae bacterium]|nr:FHA domain-containing protein [Lachnospiraceae bacterium]
MALIECANGHLYDTDQYASCPYCSGGMNRVEFGGGDSGIGKTVGAPGAVPSFDTNAPRASYGYVNPEIGATVAPSNYQAQPKRNDSDTGKTVAVLQKSMKIEPVVGWLVCIEGKDKGKDYRIAAKNNTIGRGDKMDIQIKGDDTISRENHARLAYDVKHNAFHLVPGENTNGIYLGDEPVYVPTKLKAYDLIELGESKFLFIPFCSEKFTWQDGMKQGE